MTGTTDASAPPLPNRIKNARRLDRWIRRTSYAAWGCTLLVLAVLFMYEILNITMMNRIVAGEAGLSDLWLTLARWAPVIRTLGVFTLAVGLFSTFAVFIRFRTASLAEIQTRLVSIEQALIERGE